MGTIDHYVTEEAFWSTFIRQTDFIINRIVEGAVSSLDYADEFYWREVARQHLGSEATVATPIDITLAQNEAQALYTAVMTDTLIGEE